MPTGRSFKNDDEIRAEIAKQEALIAEKEEAMRKRPQNKVNIQKSIDRYKSRIRFLEGMLRGSEGVSDLAASGEYSGAMNVQGENVLIGPAAVKAAAVTPEPAADAGALPFGDFTEPGFVDLMGAAAELDRAGEAAVERMEENRAAREKRYEEAGITVLPDNTLVFKPYERPQGVAEPVKPVEPVKVVEPLPSWGGVPEAPPKPVDDALTGLFRAVLFLGFLAVGAEAVHREASR